MGRILRIGRYRNVWPVVDLDASWATATEGERSAPPSSECEAQRAMFYLCVQMASGVYAKVDAFDLCL